MQFRVGDIVIHPAYGIGHIIQIGEKQFPNKSSARLYYQVNMPNHRTIWTPVEAQGACGLRLITAKRRLDQYRKLLKSRPVLLGNNHEQRILELVSRLKLGSFQVTCEVVRDLTLADWQKPLGITNKTILRRTEQRLYQEWASAADVSVAEATKEVDTLLRATQKEVLN